MTPSIALPAPRAVRGPGGFTAKLIVTLGLVALADAVTGDGRLGAASAGVAALWLVGLWLTRPDARRNRGAMAAIGFGFAMALALFEDASALAALLFWCAVALAALLPRAKRFDHAGRWVLRLAMQALATFFQPVDDAILLMKARKCRRPARLVQFAAALALPLGGLVVFAALFAHANPIIAGWVWTVESHASGFEIAPARIVFWLLMAGLVWASLRASRHIRPRMGSAPAAGVVRALPGVTVTSVMLSLVLFNALFAVENALDAVFLWSGAPLPAGVTLADYAHRGAYPLIATALLAGAFVLVALRPGTPMAENPALRALVYLWIAQNIFLVASSALRTMDYVEAYSLTRLRLAALIWMALVALGLALICWRMLKAKSGAWLINANAVALAAVLATCAFVDLGSVAARWNVRHAAEISGKGAALDLGYLAFLGTSATGAMLELDDSSFAPPLRQSIRGMRDNAAWWLKIEQADWRSWTFRGARRLAALRTATEADAAKDAAIANEGE